MIFTNGYHHALDRAFDEDIEDSIEEPIELTTGDKSLNTNLGPQELGASLNPFEHQLQALSAKIKEGASKVEFEFFGAGKGNKERATPESFDKEERREMRELAELNEVKSSTHATVAVTGLAGFDPQRGFEEQTREQALREVKKAIDFAADATTGGAVVLHTGEWNRPIFDSHGKEIIEGKEFNFTGYASEEKKAPIMVVDERTGEVKAMRKDTPIYEPIFKTVAEYEKEKGIKLTGTEATNGETFEANDWIGVSGEAIKKSWEFDTDKAKIMFRRVPEWNSEEKKFNTVRRDWKHFRTKAKNWNSNHPSNKLSPEEIFVKTQYMNQVLQAKGSSLFHGRYYDQEKKLRDEALKALKFYSQLSDSLSEEEKRKLVTQKHFDQQGLIPPKDISIVEYLKNKVTTQEDSMRYIHETSAAADVQATQAEEAMEKIVTVKDYGLKQSAKSLGELGVETWQKYEANKEHLKDELYIAPENWDPNQYGSHPDELLDLVKAGRKNMIDRLSPSMGKERAEELAQKHIKTTIDIGHLNMWKSRLKRKTDENGVPTETDEQFNKRFGKWVINKVDKLHKEKALGHFHLADNFGYDDEHLTVGKGNAPIKEFIEFLSEKGYKDFVVEPGSFNPQTSTSEAWSYFGSPVYGMQTGHPRRFSQVHKQHFGYDEPPMYIVGGYAPSNEWKLWSEVPLE